MTIRQVLAASALTLGIAGTAFGLAQAPGERVNPRLHPNIAEAQQFCDRALNKITDAQRANEYDMGGHAAKAKALLEQANVELKSAAMEANKH